MRCGTLILLVCWLLGRASLSCAAAGFSFFEPVTPPRRIQTVARHGEAGQAPENSRPALLRCAEDGVEWASVDVARTKDGQHLLWSATSADGAASARTLADWEAVDIGTPYAAKYRGEHPLPLAKALELAKGRLNLVLECRDADGRQLAGEVRAAGMESQVLIQGTPEFLQQVRADGVGKLGLLAVLPPGGDAAWAAEQGLAAVEIEASAASPALCESFHQRGIRVEARVPGGGDPFPGFTKAAAAGVDLVQTDVPEEWVAFSLAGPLAHRPVRFSLHRGANRYAPENTLPAFAKAIRLHADFVEFDVRTTSDGKLFLLHDSVLDGKTDGKGRIADTSSQVIAGISAGVKFGQPYAGVRMPSLDEFLDLTAGKVELYFDAKAIAPDALAASLERHGVTKDAVVYGGPAFLAKVKAADPRIRLLPPLESPDELDALARDLHPYAVDASWEILSPALIARCHQLGIKVFSDALGAHESVEQYLKAMDWGIDLIQTDHPLRVLRAIELRAPARVE